jgi:hypothetical protein
VYSLGVVLLELLTGLPAVDTFLSPPHLVERLSRALRATAKRGGASLGDVRAGGWPLHVYRDWVRLVLACTEARSTVCVPPPTPPAAMKEVRIVTLGASGFGFVHQIKDHSLSRRAKRLSHDSQLYSLSETGTGRAPVTQKSFPTARAPAYSLPLPRVGVGRRGRRWRRCGSSWRRCCLTRPCSCGRKWTRRRRR